MNIPAPSMPEHIKTRSAMNTATSTTRSSLHKLPSEVYITYLEYLVNTLNANGLYLIRTSNYSTVPISLWSMSRIFSIVRRLFSILSRISWVRRENCLIGLSKCHIRCSIILAIVRRRLAINGQPLCSTISKSARVMRTEFCNVMHKHYKFTSNTCKN